MAFNGSGTFVRVHDWTTDLSTSIPVTASRMDAEHDGFADGLTNTICRDGQSTTTARIPFASGLSATAGSSSAAAYCQTNDTNTGFYFPGADQWALTAGGATTLSSTSAKLTAAVAVDFSGLVAPTSSDGAALGSTAQMWSDLFLAAGAVVNWNNGDVTLTHSANALAFTGASSGYSFDAPLAVSSGGAAITGNSTVTGTLGVSSDLAVNTNKFNVAAASGNTTIAGTLGVAGTVTASNGLTVSSGTVSLPSGSVVQSALTSGAQSFQAQLLHVRDEKVSNTAAQTLTGTATRNLNSVLTNEISGASLASNQITLPAGTYFIDAAAQHTSGNANAGIRWQNVTDGSTVIKGWGNSNTTGWVHVRGRFSIASQKTFELQHVVQTSATGGTIVNNGIEVYADVLIWKTN